MGLLGDFLGYAKQILLLKETVSELVEEVEKTNAKMADMSKAYSGEIAGLKNRVSQLEGQLKGMVDGALLVNAASISRHSVSGHGEQSRLEHDEESPAE